MEDAYVAGLFDGEGMVRVNKWNKPNSKHVRYQLWVSIANTHRPVLEIMHERFGGVLKANRHDLRNPNNRICYSWILGSQKAASFLRLVLPHLIIKREQAELGLKLQESIDAYKHTKLGNQYGFHPDRERVHAERQRIADEITRLKWLPYGSLSAVGPVRVQ